MPRSRVVSIVYYMYLGEVKLLGLVVELFSVNICVRLVHCVCGDGYIGQISIWSLRDHHQTQNYSSIIVNIGASARFQHISVHAESHAHALDSAIGKYPPTGLKSDSVPSPVKEMILSPASTCVFMLILINTV